MRYILTSEGKIEHNAGTFAYQYFHKDHLGNTRVTFKQNGEIVQTADYYPFGLRHEPMALEDAGQKYLYNGKELQPELGWYDYGARMYDASLGRWYCIDPLGEEYISATPYAYVLNNPVFAIDPDGERVYFIIYTGGSGDAYDAARTRIKEIQNSDDFNSETDHIYFLQPEDLGQLEGLVNESIKDAEENGYGLTVEASFFGHSGVDGPVGMEDASQDNLAEATGNNNVLSGDQKQLSPAGWKKINFNFDPNGSVAAFYGCQSTEFAQKYLHYSNVKYTMGLGGRTGGSYTYQGEFRNSVLPLGRNVYMVDAVGGEVLPREVYSRDMPKD